MAVLKENSLDVFLKEHQAKSIEDLTEEQLIDFLKIYFFRFIDIMLCGTPQDKKEAIMLGKKAVITNKDLCICPIGDECPPDWYKKGRLYKIFLEDFT